MILRAIKKSQTWIRINQNFEISEIQVPVSVNQFISAGKRTRKQHITATRWEQGTTAL